MGYPVYYDTLSLFNSEDIEIVDSSFFRERRIEVPSLGTNNYLISSFHRPISKVYLHAYRRRPKTFNTL